MRLQRVWGVYFSPTGTTQKAVIHIAGQIAQKAGIQMKIFDFTLPEMRLDVRSFDEKDLVIFGIPVYAGRVPNILLKYLHTIQGNGASVVPVVLFGNRNFDDALAELKDILEEDGFRIIGAGAFVGEHSFSNTLAARRPDEEDLQIASELAEKIIDKCVQKSLNTWLHTPIAVPGNSPSPGYYQPRDRDGNFIDIRKVKPLVSEECNDCGICAKVCPMGSIDSEEVRKYTGICIKCGACIKRCPRNARYYDDTGYLYHKKELEEGLKRRAKSEIWS